MIRTFLVASLALTASAAALSQAPAASARRAAPDARGTYDALLAEYTAESEASSAARRAIYESDAYKAAREARDNQAAAELLKDAPTVDREAWAERFLAAADKFSKSADQPLFYAWVATNGASKELIETALAPMLDQHLKSDHWLDLSSKISRASRMLGHERTLAVLGTLVDVHPHKEVKANALFSRYNLVTRARGADAPNEEQKAAAERDRKRAIELAPDSKSGMRAAAVDFERERLQIGMQVPDIEGEDTSGVNFKLSDYAGKVIVLDFWGDW